MKVVRKKDLTSLSRMARMMGFVTVRHSNRLVFLYRGQKVMVCHTSTGSCTSPFAPEVRAECWQAVLMRAREIVLRGTR